VCVCGGGGGGGCPLTLIVRLQIPNQFCAACAACLQTLIKAHFSPAASTGERYVYTGSADGAVVIYDLLQANGAGDATHTVLRGHRGLVRDVAWHPTLPLLLSASFDGSVGVWGHEGAGEAMLTQREWRRGRHHNAAAALRRESPADTGAAAADSDADMSAVSTANGAGAAPAAPAAAAAAAAAPAATVFLPDGITLYVDRRPEHEHDDSDDGEEQFAEGGDDSVYDLFD
jgi:WD40 repeat protein